MTNEDLHLDPELASLLKTGRELDEVPEGVRRNLTARLATAVPGFLPASAPTIGEATGRAHAGAAGAKAGVGAKLALFGGGLLLGGGLGAAITVSLVASSTPKIVYVDRPVDAAVSATAPLPASAASVRADELPLMPTSSSGHGSETGEAAFRLERRLVDDARTAYARGDNAAALSALSTHASRYPAGALTEEREALAVRVLVDMGKKDEARARGRRFLSRYPHSLMLPAVQAALDSL